MYEPGDPNFDDKHLEGRSPKAAADEYAATVTADDRFHFQQSDLDRVQRRLKQRHVQMFVSFAYHASVAHHTFIAHGSYIQDRREYCLPVSLL